MKTHLYEAIIVKDSEPVEDLETAIEVARLLGFDGAEDAGANDVGVWYVQVTDSEFATEIEGTTEFERKSLDGSCSIAIEWPDR